MENNLFIDEQGRFHHVSEMIVLHQPPPNIQAGKYHPTCCYVKTRSIQHGERLSAISRDLKAFDTCNEYLGSSKPIQHGLRRMIWEQFNPNDPARYDRVVKGLLEMECNHWTYHETYTAALFSNLNTESTQ